MSPAPWIKQEPKKDHPALTSPEVTQSASPEPIKEARATPTVIMTQVDSYLHEMISAQPSTVDEAVSHVLSYSEESGLHRMSLPEFFEKLSYDCTRGNSCTIHQKGDKGKVMNPGKYVFRWVLKDKRAIDYAKNVRGWSLVSRIFQDFLDAPRTLFTAHGGVEIGDAVLCVMPVDRALKIRQQPGKISLDRLKGQMTPSKQKPGKVLMTGDPDSEHVYEPASAAQGGEEEVSSTQPGGMELQEGRDF